MRIVNFQQGTSEWHRWRDAGVTASDAAVALGLSAYKTPWRLWAEKVGLAMPDDLDSNPIVREGKEREPAARTRYEERHNTLLLPVCAESSDHPEIRASFDGVDSAGMPVELKCSTDTTFADVMALGRDSEAYMHYWVQVQLQLFVADRDEAMLVFDAGEAGYEEFRVPVDPEFLALAVPKLLDFVAMVRDRRPPVKDPSRDVFTPETEETRTLWSTLATALRDIDARASEAKKVLEAIDKERAAVQDQLVLLMGEFANADHDGVMVSRYSQRGPVDYTALLNAMHPNLPESVVDQYRKPSAMRIKVTLSKPKKAKKGAEPTAKQAAA